MGLFDGLSDFARDFYGFGPMQEHAAQRARDKRRAEIKDALDAYFQDGSGDVVLDELARRIARNVKR